MSSGRMLYYAVSKYFYAVILMVAAVVVLFRGEHFTDSDGPHVLPTLMCILFGLTTGITALVMIMGGEESRNQS